MHLYAPKQLADSMRVVRKNTIAIAADVPEAEYDYRPTPDSRSVREILLHVASRMSFDFHVHQQQRRTSLVGFNFPEFFAGLPTNERSALSREEILGALREDGERWCDWIENLPESHAAEIVELPGAPPAGKSRFEMLIGTKEHEMHHRAQLMVFQRLLGIVPHLTRNRQPQPQTPQNTGA